MTSNKVVLIGPERSGKSSLIERFKSNRFEEGGMTHYTTIGANFCSSLVSVSTDALPMKASPKRETLLEPSLLEMMKAKRSSATVAATPNLVRDLGVDDSELLPKLGGSGGSGGSGGHETEVKIGIWDLSGHTRYSSLIPYYLKDTQVLMICFQGVPSLSEVRNYIIEAQIFECPNVILVLTQIDKVLRGDGPYVDIDRNVDSSLTMLKKYCEQNAYHLELTSAKSGYNVKRLFTLAAKMCFEHTGDPNLSPKMITGGKASNLARESTCCFVV